MDAEDMQPSISLPDLSSNYSNNDFNIYMSSNITTEIEGNRLKNLIVYTTKLDDIDILKPNLYKQKSIDVKYILQDIIFATKPLINIKKRKRAAKEDLLWQEKSELEKKIKLCKPCFVNLGTKIEIIPPKALEKIQIQVPYDNTEYSTHDISEAGEKEENLADLTRLIDTTKEFHIKNSNIVTNLTSSFGDFPIQLSLQDIKEDEVVYVKEYMNVHNKSKCGVNKTAVETINRRGPICIIKRDWKKIKTDCLADLKYLELFDTIWNRSMIFKVGPRGGVQKMSWTGGNKSLKFTDRGDILEVEQQRQSMANATYTCTRNDHPKVPWLLMNYPKKAYQESVIVEYCCYYTKRIAIIELMKYFTNVNERTYDLFDVHKCLSHKQLSCYCCCANRKLRVVQENILGDLEDDSENDNKQCVQLDNDDPEIRSLENEIENSITSLTNITVSDSYIENTCEDYDYRNNKNITSDSMNYENISENTINKSFGGNIDVDDNSEHVRIKKIKKDTNKITEVDLLVESSSSDDDIMIVDIESNKVPKKIDTDCNLLKQALKYDKLKVTKKYCFFTSRRSNVYSKRRFNYRIVFINVKDKKTDIYDFNFRGILISHCKTLEIDRSKLEKFSDYYVLVYEICCWYKRIRCTFMIENNSKLELSYLRTSHSCDVCCCCCKEGGQFWWLNNNNVITEKNEIYSETLIPGALVTKGHLTKNTSNTLNASLTRVAPETNNMVVPQFTTHNSNIIIEPLLTNETPLNAIPISNNDQAQVSEDVVNIIISEILENFKGLQLTLDANRRVVALIDRPTQNMSTVDLKILRQILNHAQAQVDAFDLNETNLSSITWPCLSANTQLVTVPTFPCPVITNVSSLNTDPEHSGKLISDESNLSLTNITSNQESILIEDEDLSNGDPLYVKRVGIENETEKVRNAEIFIENGDGSDDVEVSNTDIMMENDDLIEIEDRVKRKRKCEVNKESSELVDTDPLPPETEISATSVINAITHLIDTNDDECILGF